MNNLTIQLDKPYFSQISASGTTNILANSTNILNLTAGSSIVYSTISTSLQIDTIDFNTIKVPNKSTIYSSYLNKTLNLSTSGDITILTDPITNTLTFSVFPNNSYSYSNISVFDSTNLQVSTTTAATQNSNTINLVSVSPLKISTGRDSIYFGIDTSALLSSTTNTISTVTMNNTDMKALYIHGIPVITYSTIKGIDISANIMHTVNLSLSTIGANSMPPFCSFDFNSSFMYAHGTIVAKNFATFSDSSLKKFKSELKVSHADLLTLTPWNFDWLSDGKPDIGFAAEDVEKIAPELVKYNSNGLRMVDYSRLSVLAISALRDMNDRLKILEDKLL
jgi:hypothetical protein